VTILVAAVFVENVAPQHATKMATSVCRLLQVLLAIMVKVEQRMIGFVIAVPMKSFGLASNDFAIFNALKMNVSTCFTEHLDYELR
jgi:hypothetical protein